MKASELIARLQELMKEHGDLPVRYYLIFADTDVEEVCAYDDGGDVEGPRVEIFLH